MSDMIKIVIKGSSGYCCIEEAFNDKVTITPEFISYEYIPVIESEINPRRNWNYRTNSPIYKLTYETVTGLMAAVFERDIEEFCTDIGGIEFMITYSDKNKLHKTFWIPSDRFEELFKVIKRMVPECEYTPAVLLTSEDFDNGRTG